MATKRFMILPLLGVVLACSTALGDDSKALLEGVDAQRLKPSSSQVSASPGAGGLEVRIEAGDDGYPGLAILPPGGQPWDLSGFGHVEARVVNTGEKAFTLNLRVDNAGDWKKNPWNNESRKLKPGEATVIKVIFGHSYGYKPSFKLNPGAVTQLLLFTGKTKAPRSFRIESITAGGSAGEKPPVKPGDVRIKPTEGVLLGPGVDPQKDLKLQGKDATTIEAGGNGAVRVRFDRGGDDAAVVRPHIGRWDLRDSLLVHVKLKNVGDAPVKPRIRIETNGGPSDWASSEEPLAPGQTQTLTASFIAETPWRGPQEVKGKHIAGEHGTGARNTSDAVSGISIAAAKADAPRMVEVESITASMPVADTPDWLGKRPPVEGDWVLTLEDNFDSGRIDLDRWNIYTENYWDKRSHFSKDNVILEDGMVKLRYERKRGHENDDPSRKETNYATGFLDGYGKWT